MLRGEESESIPSLCWESHLISLCSYFNVQPFISLLGCSEEAKGLSGSEIIEHCVIERLEMYPWMTHQLPALSSKNCHMFF